MYNELEHRIARLERQLRRTWNAADGPHQHDNTVATVVERLDVDLKALRAEVRGVV
jgi:hypothetical protein